MAQLRATLTVEEEQGWVEYHQLLVEERKRATEQARAGGGKRPSRRR